ncbi:heterogeneous nuclear ribonucleoprotein 1 [Rosa chinensis]|uniref:heterogeneous nuclear ribonucleoprotein 1 n=1 Tax=Rosa chinensis TaxID=74649 RepID=UPI000D08DE2C|nr:heterogeneous nuclear ribonucleoprotein 1 [Rosa chinensis]
MDAKQDRKIFVGGITGEVDEDILEEHFSRYGVVEECVIVLDKITRQPREFGFVTFTDPLVAKRVLEEENHSIFGKTIDVRPSEPKRERNQIYQEEQYVQHQGYIPTKIFVGGLPHDLTEDEFRDYFAKFGAIDDGIIIYDKESNTPKGFGFITFESDDAVVDVLHKQKNKFHELKDKQVEVMRALPEVKKNWHGMWRWLQFDDLAFGIDRFFCFSCGGAYGYGHFQGCLYWPNPYHGVWNIIRVIHANWIGGEVVDQSAWNGYSDQNKLTHVNSITSC